jgi:Ca2+/Na+ antiporter
MTQSGLSSQSGSTMRNTLFCLGLAALFTHELDAIANHEWKVMPILRSLPEELGFNVFVLIHIPLFAVLIALISSNNSRLRKLSRLGVGVFLVIHAGLHVLFTGVDGYEFDSALSSLLIFGGAFVGGLYLLASYKDLRHR